jgi:hypothetical protein
MSRGNASSPSGPGRSDQYDMVQFGRRRPPRGRWAAWAVLLAAAVLAAVFVTAAHGRKPPAAAASGGTPAPAAPAPVVVSELGHRLLGATGSWELFGLAGGEVVRIQPAQGRITRTMIPPLLSTGPVSFLAGPGQVIIRPLDFVPGYLVPDGRPARELRGVLGNGGPVFPGPAPGQVWVPVGSGDHVSLSLARMDGTTLGASFPVPGGDSSLMAALADGGGYVLVPGASGWYDARPGAFHLVTRGAVVAVGPTRWLAVECHGKTHCTPVVIDSAGGARRILPGNALPWWHADADIFPGTISPDGSTAAVFGTGNAGTPTLHLIDLTSGADHQLAVQGPPGAGAMAWSPDSRWLFAAASPVQARTLIAVNARTRRAADLGITLPQVSQVAVESTPQPDDGRQPRQAPDDSRKRLVPRQYFRV